MSDKAASKEPMTTRSGRSVALGSADGSETFHLSQGAKPSTAATLAAPTPSEEEDSASKESGCLYYGNDNGYYYYAC